MLVLMIAVWNYFTIPIEKRFLLYYCTWLLMVLAK